MNYKRVCTLIFQILLAVSVISQVDSSSKDTIKETTIYEYDTIYLQPDTIRITNRILDTTKTNNLKEKKKISPDFSKSNVHPFLKFITPNSYSIIAGTFIAGKLKEKKLSDSLYSQSVINMCYSFQLNYNSKRYLLSIGAGFSPFHERHYFQYDSYTTNIESNISGIYDSLLITKKYQYDYYYNYLNLNVSFGRKWKINKKWFLNINVVCVADFLVGYIQGDTNNPKYSTRKFDISLGIAPQIVYKFKKKNEFYLSPSYQHSLLEHKNFPKTSFQEMGLSLGLNIISKKK
jgi:hypothetical protein